MNKDEEHLRLLSVFHYVVGGLAALFAFFPIIHLIMGIAMIFGGFEGDSGEGPPSILGYMFVVIAVVLMLAGWAFAICLIAAGRCLSKRKHYIFCLVMAAISCLFMPFGTVLGVFTIIVLVRPAVKELFSASKGIELTP